MTGTRRIDLGPHGEPGLTLAEQFAAQPIDLQSRLFRVLDVVIGMSQDEKHDVGLQLYAVRSGWPDIDPATEKLVNAVESLMFIVERLARH